MLLMQHFPHNCFLFSKSAHMRCQGFLKVLLTSSCWAQVDWHPGSQAPSCSSFTNQTVYTHVLGTSLRKLIMEGRRGTRMHAHKHTLTLHILEKNTWPHKHIKRRRRISNLYVSPLTLNFEKVFLTLSPRSSCNNGFNLTLSPTGVAVPEEQL